MRLLLRAFASVALFFALLPVMFVTALYAAQERVKSVKDRIRPSQ